MRKVFGLLLSALMLASCNDESWTPQEPAKPVQEEEAVPHEMIELGRKLKNPYTVKNMSAAISALYPTRADAELPATDMYVRFLPDGQEDLSTLDSLGIVLFDYPLDYEIKTDGDYYHDPSIAEDKISWQYAVVPSDFVFPEEIRHEIIDECFIPKEGETTRGFEDVDWSSVEEAAFRQTGNGDMLVPETRGRRVHPEGYIKIEDDKLVPSKTFGVCGLKVLARVFVKYGQDYTDERGHYEINKKFSARPHYSLRFKNKAGFKIGFNRILVTASTSTLGKDSPSGKSITVTTKSGDKLFRRCVVNNAAYEYFTTCSSYGVTPPPQNLRIWILDLLKPSCTMMIHHGAILDNSLVNKYLKYYAAGVRILAPDITIGTKNKDYQYDKIYSVTMHELAHASHFSRVGKSYWSTLAGRMLSSLAMTGDEYGTGNGENEGMIGVSEMWGYFMEYSLYKDRYGREVPSKDDHWFHPEALQELEQKGVTKKDMYFALNSNVRDIETYFEYLAKSCPSKKAVINRVYKQYFN
jgi:hypothetical protein